MVNPKPKRQLVLIEMDSTLPVKMLRQKRRWQILILDDNCNNHRPAIHQIEINVVRP